MGHRGQTVLIVVLVMTAILTVFVVMRSDFRRHAHHETVRALAGQSALWTARARAECAVADLMRAAGDPNAPYYRELRTRILKAPVASVDLTDLCDDKPKLPAAFRWAGPRRAEGPVGSVSVERVTARVERLDALPRPDGLAGTREDECAGLLVVEAAASATVGGVTVRRALTECRELKVTLAGPPRPFEAVSLYVGDLARLTDPARANRARAKLFEQLDWAVQKLSAVPDSMPMDQRQRLGAIAGAIPTGAARETGMPPLPERPAALVHVDDPHETKIDLSRLDLAALLEADLIKIGEQRGDIERGLGSNDPQRAEELVDKATTLARWFNQALMRGWFFQKSFRLVTRDDAGFTQGIGPYEGRLSPAWYHRRTVHRLDPAGAVFREWRAGTRQLAGVFEVPGSARLDLSGPVGGRAVLVCGAAEVNLRDMPAADPGEHLTLVVDAGRVTIGGTVHASLILGDRASLVMDASSHLFGTLIWARPAQRLALAGMIENDPQAAAGATPQTLLGAPGFAPYAIALSPQALWTEGERQ